MRWIFLSLAEIIVRQDGGKTKKHEEKLNFSAFEGRLEIRPDVSGALHIAYEMDLGEDASLASALRRR